MSNCLVSPPDLVIDILHELSACREDQPEVPRILSRFILELIHHLEIPGIQVGRIASCLFSNFIRKHVSDVVLEVQRSSDVSWQGTRTNLKNQILLRVLTCISIASKFDNQTPSFTKIGQRILSLLACLSNPSFTIRSIKKSEIRVLETVNWYIEKNVVIESIHILLLVLRLNSVFVESRSFFLLVCHLLDLFELCWNSLVAGTSMNAIYMSAVIISVSTFVSCGSTKSKMVTKELTFITPFDSCNIFENRDALLLILSSPFTS